MSKTIPSSKAKGPVPVSVDLGQQGKRKLDLSGTFAASVSEAADMQHATMISIDKLHSNPYQPRIEMNEETLNELAEVIKAQGFQGVLVARPHPTKIGYYQITAGHRRREAARRSGLAVLPVVVKDLSDEEMVTLTITENIQRDDLTPLEEGRVYLLMSDEMGYTQEQIAREIGKTRGYIRNRIRVAEAPADIQRLVQAKPDTLRAIVYLSKVQSERDRSEVIEGLLKGTLNTNDLPGYIADLASSGAAGEKEMRDEYTTEPSPGIQGSDEKAEQNNGEEIDAQLKTGVARISSSPTLSAFRDASSQNENALQAGIGLSSRPHIQEHKHQKLTPTPKKSQVDIEADREIRARKAKLTTVMRGLLSYKELALLSGDISEEEHNYLLRIAALVDELRQGYNLQAR